MYRVTVPSADPSASATFDIHTEKLAKVAIVAIKQATGAEATYANLRVLKPKAIKTPTAKQLEAARALIAMADAAPVAAPVVAVAAKTSRKKDRPVAAPAAVAAS
jgi:hypothetical protein